MNVGQRFWSKVEQPLEFKKCWEWVAGKSDTGYGLFTLDGVPVLVHRFAYQQLKGPIPKGLTLDHLCRNRVCVNPFHLEPVTVKENVLRGFSPSAINAKKTHCPKGHPLSGDNLDKCHLKHGRRQCRRCKNMAQSPL